MAQQAARGLAAILDIAQKHRPQPLRFRKYAVSLDRLTSAPKFLCLQGDAVYLLFAKAVLNLSGIDKLTANAPPQINAIEFPTLESQSRDDERFALAAGHFGPHGTSAG